MSNTGKIRLGSHCPPITDAQGQPVLSLPADWQGLVIEETVVPARAECGPQYTGVPTLIIGVSANVKRWYRSGCHTLELDAPPPAFDILGSAYERDHGRWDGEEGSSLKVTLPESVLQRYLPEQAHCFDMETRFAVTDHQLRDTLIALATEFKQGLPNGLMYAEGLSLMALGWLNAHYSYKGKQNSAGQKLSVRQKQQIDDYIYSSLGEAITVDKIAALINISPSHLFLLFRSSFGMPPHQYVLKKRVERVAQLLKSEPERSISDIAIATGFSSQAHMTKVFKRFMQQTPSRWKVQ